MNKIIRFFPNTDLRSGHDGLRRLALAHNFDPFKLQSGEYLIFANRAKNKVKVYASGNIVAYAKTQDDRPFDLNAIRFIPRHFNGASLNLNGPTRDAMFEWAKRRALRRVA